MAGPFARGTPEERVIRVFVSSTFRDMQPERDELILRVFPQLRQLCEERGVTWGEVDLRWGISDEQKAEGKVLPICLQEIKNCRPYFLGFLGERYGWVPDQIPADVLKLEPWVAIHADGDHRKSVTELEILHGVLNNPAMADHAFFYFRDPDHIETISEERRPDYICENAESAAKLRRLKDDIRQHYRDGKLKYEPRENYPDARALGERVLADFTALIDELYPPGEQPSSLERELFDHEAFARSRANVYVARQEYFDRLGGHVAGDGPPLVVRGESGIGKSALLANWAQYHRRQHPKDFVLLHFIGSSPESANATGMLRRIMSELKQHFRLLDEVPTQAEKIREAFPEWLTQVAGCLGSGGAEPLGRFILVLDGLNQLEDVDAAPDLGWLPTVFPRNCRLIVSTLPGRSMDALERRGWLTFTPPLEVRPLDAVERRQLIRDFLTQYSRDLGLQRTERLINAPQTANPLYLRVLLDELRVFGVYEKLNERIDWYLEARDPLELYSKVIHRWEEAYGDGSGLVREVLTMLWAARRGLSEAELRDVVGRQGYPLPSAMWSPLYLAMSAALLTRSGLMTFAHDFLRGAVQTTCLVSELERQSAHAHLADYFMPRENDGRRIDELPFQLHRARDYDRLEQCLTDLPFLDRMMEVGRLDELVEYWEPISHRMFDAYRQALVAAHNEGLPMEEWGTKAAKVAGIMVYSGRHDDAAQLCLWAHGPVQHQLGEAHPVAFALANNLALALQFKGDLRGAAQLQQWLLGLIESRDGDRSGQIADSYKAAVVMGNLALTMRESGDFAMAEHYGREAVRVVEHYLGPSDPATAMALNNLGLSLLSAAKFDEAEEVYGRALEIRRAKLGAQHPATAYTLTALGSLYLATGRPEAAERVLRESLAIREQALGPRHPETGTTMNELAVACRAIGKVEEGLQLLRGVLDILASSLGIDHPRYAATQNNVATILYEQGKLDDAEPLFRAALETRRRRLGMEHPDTAGSEWGLGVLLAQRLDFAAAGELMDRALATSRKVLGAHHPQTQQMANEIQAFELFRNVRVADASQELEEENPVEHDPQEFGYYGGDLDDLPAHIAGGDERDNASLAKIIYNRGLYEESKGNVKDALQAYELAVQADPNLGPAFFNMAQIWLRYEEDEGARVNLERLLSITPDDTEARIQLAGVYLRLGDKQVASAHLSRAYADALQLWNAGRQDELLPILIDLNARVKNDGQLLYMLGHIYREKGEFDVALDHLHRARAILPAHQIIPLEIKFAEDRSAIRLEVK